MAKDFIWKVWLEENKLTKDKLNDYFADVSTAGNTLHNADLARLFAQRRSDHSAETVLSILDECDKIALETLQRGSSVQNRNIHVSPRVTGSWEGSVHQFDPKVHKLTVDAIPTATLRAGLEEVGVEVLGARSDGGAFIGRVTDVKTGKTDGTITPGGDIIVEGEKIRLIPIGYPGVGLSFHPVDGSPATQDLEPFVQNDPKKVIAHVPATLTPRQYILQIGTRYANSDHLLKNPRTIRYALPLTVK